MFLSKSSFVFILAACLLCLPPTLAAQLFEQISQTPEGDYPNGGSFYGRISGNGRYVVYGSGASNIASAADGERFQIYVFDRKTGLTELISQNTDGEPGNDTSSGAFISQNGRFVVFGSLASNLVSGDTNELRDCFIYDRELSSLSRVTLELDGEEVSICNDATYTRPAATISASGRYMVFIRNGLRIYDTESAEHSVVTTPGGEVIGAARAMISADGNSIVFNSATEDIVSPHPASDSLNLYIYRRDTGEFILATKGIDGQGANANPMRPSISDDGKRVLFDSFASNLIEDDTNNRSDVFVYDVETDSVLRVSNFDNESAQNSAFSHISGNGKFATYASEGIFITEIDTLSNKKVVEALAFSVNYPFFDFSGYRLSFSTDAPLFMQSDTNNTFDIFVHKENPCETNADSDENGVPDCLDPNGQIKPEAPMFLRQEKRTATLLADEFEGEVEYRTIAKCKVNKRGTLVRKVRKARGSDSRIELKKMKGRCTVSYTVSSPVGRTKKSKKLRMRF